MHWRLDTQAVTRFVRVEVIDHHESRIIVFRQHILHLRVINRRDINEEIVREFRISFQKFQDVVDRILAHDHC